MLPEYHHTVLQQVKTSLKRLVKVGSFWLASLTCIVFLKYYLVYIWETLKGARYLVVTKIVPAFI